MVYPLSLPKIQKFLSSSRNSSIIFYILCKSYTNSEFSLALNAPSVIYMMKHHCIYFTSVFLHKKYGTNLRLYLAEKIDLSVLTSQIVIFGFADVQYQNYILFNHLLLIFNYNLCNFQSLKCFLSEIKCMEKQSVTAILIKMKNFK